MPDSVLPALVAVSSRLGLPLAGHVPWFAPGDADEATSRPRRGRPRALGLWVDAGIPVLDALHAATVAPARWLGRADSVGTVAEGMRADLLLVSGDPRDDWHTLLAVEGVVLRGRWLTRAALDAAEKPLTSARS